MYGFGRNAYIFVQKYAITFGFEYTSTISASLKKCWFTNRLVLFFQDNKFYTFYEILALSETIATLCIYLSNNTKQSLAHF